MSDVRLPGVESLSLIPSTIFPFSSVATSLVISALFVKYPVTLLTLHTIDTVWYKSLLLLFSAILDKLSLINVLFPVYSNTTFESPCLDVVVQLAVDELSICTNVNPFGK